MTPHVSTTGLVYMWNGTTDNQDDGYINTVDGSTNVKPSMEVTVEVEDVRNLTEPPKVSSHGYQLVKFTSSLPSSCFLDAYSPENKRLIEEVYYDECRGLVQDFTGAVEAFPYVYRIRNQSADVTRLADIDFHKDSAPIVHVDRDSETAPDRLRYSLGADRANSLLARYKRYASINVWRPIGTKVQKWPLLLVNHQSVANWDYSTHMGRVHFSNDQKRVGARGTKSHETVLKFDPGYVYHYAGEMAPNEAWLFYAFHSEPKFAIPHSAFWDQSTEVDARTRWSIEVRIWVFFEDP
ncbi:MAG: hypothetical protein CL912_06715 [Deltaproteobacteria bacterium]|nr:hypothetical protein [Deltaproteobacteria bacterium]|tara:strand:- start:105 stop:989 length:885 start_codon:yes stop_codon:yes gene_type:complete